MRGTEWFCGVQLGGVKLPAEFPAACSSKSMVHAGTDIGGVKLPPVKWPHHVNGGKMAGCYQKAVVEAFFFKSSACSARNTRRQKVGLHFRRRLAPHAPPHDAPRAPVRSIKPDFHGACFRRTAFSRATFCSAC